MNKDIKKIKTLEFLDSNLEGAEMAKVFSYLTVLVSFILIPNIAYTCKCDESRLRKFFIDPSSAPVALVGKLNGTQYRIFLKVVKNWTQNQNEVNVGAGTDCDYSNLKFGKMYLLLAEKSFNMEGANKVSPCDSLLFELSDETDSIIKNLSPKKYFYGEINPSWQFCKRDNECLQVKNKCGNYIGVNKKYKDTYLDFLKTTTKKFDCSKRTPTASVSKCIDNFCS